MNDATNRSLEEVLSAERKVEKLPSRLAEGIVFKIMLEENEKGSSGILLLLADSAIKKHKHINDWEEYTFPDGHVERCSVGDSHQLKNETGDLLVIYFAKHRVF